MVTGIIIVYFATTSVQFGLLAIMDSVLLMKKYFESAFFMDKSISQYQPVGAGSILLDHSHLAFQQKKGSNKYLFMQNGFL